MTAVTLVPDPRPRVFGGGGVGKSLWCAARGGRYAVVVPVPARGGGGWLVGSRIVDAVFCAVPTRGSRPGAGGGVWGKCSAY